MILASIFNSIEFYVIAATVAAAVVAASAIPRRRGEARTFLYAGRLEPYPLGEPAIELRVTDTGTLELTRLGLSGVGMQGAFSVAVQIIGFDVTINERLTAGRYDAEPARSAVVNLECFGRERYHFQYLSEATGRSCAFTLNISPGNRLSRPLNL